MKLCLSIVSLVVAVSAFEKINNDYHNTIGVPEAMRIKHAEESSDFDGARITGGSSSGLGEFPFMAGLLVTLTDDRLSACGSSLLTNTRLVTAAHCWKTGVSQGRLFTVILGSIHLFQGGVRIDTNNVIIHEGYNMTNFSNDVAIIIINNVSFNNNIQPIKLASGSNQYVGAWATAAGFGRTSDSSDLVSQTLNHVNLQVITNEVCRSVFGPNIIASILCVGSPSGRNICGGDSGGPLAIGSGSSRQLIGIASFVHKNGCTRGDPSGFSRVTSFNSWISARI